jgi:hypothetical protein
MHVGPSLISAERPSAPASGQRIHGSLMAGTEKYHDSDEDNLDNEESDEFERFDASGTNVIQISREPAMGGIEENTPIIGEKFGSGDGGFNEDDNF